jgi:hypothetical protein
MSALAPTINLQFGNSTLCYQDVILLTLINRAYFAVAECAQFQIIPNKRGSHSDISGT